MANKLTNILQSGTNSYYTPSLSFNRVATDHISPGVVGMVANTSGVGPAAGSFGVSAQGSPNMTVAINSGQAYVSATPTGGTAQTFGVTSDASENVTIAANATGSTKYDFIYLKLDADKLNNPASNGLDVASYTTQRSSTQYVDSNGSLANGLLICEVTVANAAASIANASISDRRLIAEPIEHDGWVNPNETWTYASATTFTITGDKTLRYNVGDKISLYQSGTRKYFYIVGVSYANPNTTVTITGGSDYTFANATVYNNLFSKVQSPNGFPQWFNFTTAYTGFSANPTTTNRFSITGRLLTMSIYPTGNGTSNATGFTMTGPVTSANSGTVVWFAPIRVTNNGGVATTPGTAQIANNTTTINLYQDYNNAVWTNANAKAATFTLQYEI